MFPSQRVHVFQPPVSKQNQSYVPPNTAQTQHTLQSEDERVDTTRNHPGHTSKIQIQHSRSSYNPAFVSLQSIVRPSSFAYLMALKGSKRVTFNGSVITQQSETEETAEANSNSILSVTESSYPVATAANVNELVGQIAIQALCNRSSVTSGLDFDFCNCHPHALQSVELERIKSLEPEMQKDELCKLMIKLVEERADKNKELLTQKEQQKLVVAKPVKALKVKHIICVGGRTLDGRNIPIGGFPNSFLEMRQLSDLRKDPPGFRRYTARFDMRGFKDNEITLTNEKNILRVTGERRKTKDQSAKKVTEEVLLPSGVFADTLKVGRSPNGMVIVQEPWKF